ncbi:DNA-binding domain-containing protein [Psychromonas sp.]|uniref:HvfC/BufC N-terminal domain-containing protein n=1 Tax=Psychromonas sp. TaxID=1884585 RepID=UPI0035691C35
MKIRQLQQQFSDTLLYKSEQITTQIKAKKDFTGNELLQVYRNNFVMGITEALSSTYQHTLALVGEEFFNAVARQFILSNPPQENNLMSYGNGFSEHLDGLEQLTNLPYVAEMARFEWLLEQTTNKKLQHSALDLHQLQSIPSDQLEKIAFQAATQVVLFSSRQNIAHLHQMMLRNEVQETDLNQPCFLALKKQPSFTVELISLSETEFLLMEQIMQKKNLGEIAPQSLLPSLPKLLEKDLLCGFK